MSLGRDWIIVQDARRLFQLASTLCDETTVINVVVDEIDTYKPKDPFTDSVPNKRYCSNACDQFEWGTKNLWLNSKLEKSDNKPQISLRNASAESVVAEVATLTKDTNLVTTMFLKLLEATSLVFILL